MCSPVFSYLVTYNHHIYKAEKPSVCLHSFDVSRLSRQPMHVSKRFVCQTERSSSSLLKEVLTTVVCRLRHVECNSVDDNSLKSSPTFLSNHRHTALLLAHQTVNPKVQGSIPAHDNLFVLLTGTFLLINRLSCYKLIQPTTRS